MKQPKNTLLMKLEGGGVGGGDTTFDHRSVTAKLAVCRHNVSPKSLKKISKNENLIPLTSIKV